MGRLSRHLTVVMLFVLIIGSWVAVTAAFCDNPVTTNATLSLNVVPTSLYVKPGATVIVNMDVSNLPMKVNACQAMLGYNSTFFLNPTGGAIQTAGSGPWDQVIWDSWKDSTGTPGEIDTAIGVDAQGSTGTDANSTVAKITLITRSGVQGVTNLIFRQDANPDPGLVKSTFLSDMNSNPVWPHKIDSQQIVIDGTPPAEFSMAVDNACVKDNVTLTFSTTDILSGMDHYELFVDGASKGTVTSPYTFNLAAFGDGAHTLRIDAYDKCANVRNASTSVSADTTGPVIAGVAVKQGTRSVLCPDKAVQGMVDIYVTVNDAGCAGVTTPPGVSVAGIGAASYVDAAGGVYHYTVKVLPTTANGPHVITVSASDSLGNTSTDSARAICVDKNQITGQIKLQDFTGTSRAVTFVATGGSETKTWTVTDLAFNAGAANYVLTNVPAGTKSLSAKTSWSLRKKINVTLNSDNQAVTNFTGPNTVLGGDIDESNSVNILDYGIMKTNWHTTNSVADVTGDGEVTLADYSTMKSNWFLVGDPQ